MKSSRGSATPKVICLGEILFDCLADQMGQELSNVSSWTAYPGGAPANVACALANLGSAAAFIGCVGHDPPGDELVSLLKETGVDITGVQRCAGAPTRKVYVTRSIDGERHFSGFGSFDSSEFADTQLSANSIPDALFSGARFLVTGTLGLAYPESRQAIAQVLTLAREYQVNVFVDVNWRPIFWQQPDAAKPLIFEVLQQADLIKCTDEEAEWLFETQNPADIAQRYPKAQAVLVTAGEKGCRYCLGDHQGQVSAFPVDVIDTTGAGDSFVAGFLHYLCLQEDRVFTQPEIAHNAVLYGSAVGALTTVKSGAIAAQPTAADVDDFLRQSINVEHKGTPLKTK